MTISAAERFVRDLVRRIYFWSPKICSACGKGARIRHHDVLWPELGRQWELSPASYAWFSAREGSRCARCGASLRNRQMAAVLLEQWNNLLGSAHRSLHEITLDPRMDRFQIAEINAAGRLHAILKQLPNLHYSEFGGSMDAPSEDLNRLTYGDSTFDFVITSDTLEHVPDFKRAVREIRRILKPGGIHVFTIPVLWDRKSRTRASLKGNEIVHHLPPSHHRSKQTAADDLLVFTEFGRDVVQRIEQAGFDVEVIRDPTNPTLNVFVARRQ